MPPDAQATDFFSDLLNSCNHPPVNKNRSANQKHCKGSFLRNYFLIPSLNGTRVSHAFPAAYVNAMEGSTLGTFM